MSMDNEHAKKINATIDVVKLLMAYLVIGIHTGPFANNIWLDRGFGILTRLCVPFFFVASGYFFWIHHKDAKVYVKRILLLYIFWSIIYLPFDYTSLKSMAFQDILYKYLWIGNDHALWYLCGSIVGFLIVFLLSKFLDAKKVFIISATMLLIGCLKSTYAPMVEQILNFKIIDYFGGVEMDCFTPFPT